MLVRRKRVVTLNLDRASPNKMVFLEQETQSEMIKVRNPGRIQS